MSLDLTRFARHAMIGAAWLGALATGACKDKSKTADTDIIERPTRWTASAPA